MRTAGVGKCGSRYGDDHVFDLRSRDNDVMELMIQKLRGAAENAAASIGAKADFTILHQTPASIITPEITEIIGK